MNSTKTQKSLTPWYIFWGTMFLTINFCSLFYQNEIFTSIIKVSSIGFCLLYILLYFRFDKLLVLAMTTTLIADLILAIDNTAIFGVIFFFITQIIHFVRLNSPCSVKIRKFIISFTSISTSLILFMMLTNLLPPMFALAPLYLFMICTNIYVSRKWAREEPKNLRAKFAFYGFVLFLACDICVGISYLSLTQAFPGLLYAPANFLAWFFYYPAQILISNSTKHDKMVTKERKLCYNGGNYGR